jgi:hypothetical protein
MKEYTIKHRGENEFKHNEKLMESQLRNSDESQMRQKQYALTEKMDYCKLRSNKLILSGYSNYLMTLIVNYACNCET